MRIAIHGRYFNKRKRRLLRDLARWSGKKLMGQKLYRQIDIKVHIVAPDAMKNEDAYGWCEIEDYAGPYARGFVITMTSKFEIMRSLVILAHEMVHVKQYAKGELRHCGQTGCLRWNGTNTIDDGSTQYWDLPWEIEAHGREKGLVYQWAEAKGYNKNTNWFRTVF
jgi:hypothetical protein